MNIETTVNGKIETYHNVTHVSVVGNWLYLTLVTGEWAKLDSRDATVEIADFSINVPHAKPSAAAEWPETDAETERLRLKLIQASCDFMATINDESLVNFMAVERRNIIRACLAESVRIDNQIFLKFA